MNIAKLMNTLSNLIMSGYDPDTPVKIEVPAIQQDSDVTREFDILDASDNDGGMRLEEVAEEQYKLVIKLSNNYT